ncbi:MAG: PIG-L family deacetylase [Acidimicrobiales bacterium]
MNTTTSTLPRPVSRSTTPLAGAGERLLVVVAHPDDETFGCGSIIAAASAAGAEVTVACATPGDRGQSRLDLSPRQLAQQRQLELHLAAQVLGVRRVVTFDYGDSDFSGDLPDGSLCAADRMAVVRDVLRVLREVAPDVVVVLDGCDGHRDHQRIREATYDAVEVAHVCGQQIALYESSLPNHLMRAWLDEMRSIDPSAAYHSIDPASFGRPDDEITHVVDATSVLRTRELAISMHSSQSSPFDGLSPELRRAFLATDHLVRVC